MRGSLLTLAVLAGCDLFEPKPVCCDDDDTAAVEDSDADTYTDADSDTDADTDSDTDTDTDADTDADTDSDTDVDTGLCDETFSTAAPAGPDCITERVACGDVIEATTEGGGSAYVGEDWESWYCTPNLDRWDYDAPERVYAMEIPENTTATFTFETPCADLDFFVFYWQNEDSCPTSANSIIECETVDDTGDGGVRSVWSDVGAQYLLAVDSRSGETGNFRVTIDCD